MKYLIFLPSINLGLLTSEIFPWIFLYRPRKKINITFFVFAVWIFVISSVLWLINLSFQWNFVISYFSIIIGPYAYFHIMKISEREDLRYVAGYLLFFLIALSLFQYLGIFSTLLDSIIKFLVPRGEGGVIGHGRGVTLLDSEPSRAGMNVIFLSAVGRSLLKSALWRLAFDILVCIVVLFLVKSAIAAAYLLVYVLCYRFKFSIFVLSIFVTANMTVLSADSRALDVLHRLLSVDRSNFISTLIALSGHRGITLLASWENVFNFVPMGLGSWSQQIMFLYQLTGIEASEIPFFMHNYDGVFAPAKPSSYAAFMILELGFYGFVSIILLLLLVLRKSWHHDLWPVATLFLFHLFVVGGVGNPVPWISLAILKHRTLYV